MTPLPESWRKLRHGSSRVLIGFDREVMHVIAPPGVRIWLDESNEERVLWRHAIWTGSRRGGPPLLTIDPPDLVSGLDTRQVVELLPKAQHDFVRISMATQLTRAWTYVAPAADSCLEERRARIGGRSFSWITGQLLEAFPAESWFQSRIDRIEIPDTAAEFLRCLPAGPDPEPRIRRLGGWLGRFGPRVLLRVAWSEVRWGFDFALLTLRCQLWVGGLTGRLRPQDWEPAETLKSSAE